MENFKQAIKKTKKAQKKIRYKVGKSIIIEFLKKVRVSEDIDINSHRMAFDIHFDTVLIFMYISDENLEIQPDRSEIRHKIRPIDNSDESKGSEEDIDEVFEPLTEGELKKLKLTVLTNQYKLKKVV